MTPFESIMLIVTIGWGAAWLAIALSVLYDGVQGLLQKVRFLDKKGD